MIWVLASIGYILIGVVAGRAVYKYKMSRHPYHSSFEEKEARMAAVATMFLWPIALTIIAVVMSTKSLLFNDLPTVKLPKRKTIAEKNAELEARLKEEEVKYPPL